MISILLLVNQSSISQGLHMCLSIEKDMVVLGNAYHIDNAFTLMKSLHPSVVLIDADTMNTDALALAQSFSKEYPGTKIIFLCLNADQPIWALACSAGVAGIIGKTWSTSMLINTIRQVAIA